MVGACCRSEAGHYMEDFEHTLDGINAYGIRDIETEMSITETGAESLAKQACHERRQALYLKSMRTDTFNSRFRPSFQIINSVFILKC